MNTRKTVREWIKAFNEGKFDIKDTDIQIEAGWFDWFCSDKSLMNRLKKMGNIIKDIKNDFILDNYYVWFKNNCPYNAPLYDDFRFEPLDKNKREYLYFGVQCDHPFGKECRYEIFTARNNYETEFKCNSKKEVLNFINKIGQELQMEITK